MDLVPAPETDTLIDAICDLALEIARLSPDAAERAQHLVSLAGQLRKAMPLDRGAIQDAITVETADSDLSDAAVRTTTEAVVRAARDRID